LMILPETCDGPPESHHTLLVAGRAEPTALARKGQSQICPVSSLPATLSRYNPDWTAFPMIRQAMNPK
jgi:hypothetical protein